MTLPSAAMRIVIVTASASGRTARLAEAVADGARDGGELALLSLFANLAEHGMLLVPMPNRLEGFGAAGCHWGPVAWTNPRQGRSGPTDAHLVAARAHGRHVAECTARSLAGRS